MQHFSNLVQLGIRAECNTLIGAELRAALISIEFKTVLILAEFGVALMIGVECEISLIRA